MAGGRAGAVGRSVVGGQRHSETCSCALHHPLHPDSVPTIQPPPPHRPGASQQSPVRPEIFLPARLRVTSWSPASSRPRCCIANVHHRLITLSPQTRTFHSTASLYVSLSFRRLAASNNTARHTLHPNTLSSIHAAIPQRTQHSSTPISSTCTALSHPVKLATRPPRTRGRRGMYNSRHRPLTPIRRCIRLLPPLCSKPFTLYMKYRH